MAVQIVSVEPANTEGTINKLVDKTNGGLQHKQPLVRHDTTRNGAIAGRTLQLQPGSETLAPPGVEQWQSRAEQSRAGQSRADRAAPRAGGR